MKAAGRPVGEIAEFTGLPGVRAGTGDKMGIRGQGPGFRGLV